MSMLRVILVSSLYISLMEDRAQHVTWLYSTLTTVPLSPS